MSVKRKGEKLLIKIDYGWYWDYKHNKAIELVTEYTVIPSLFLAFTQYIRYTINMALYKNTFTNLSSTHSTCLPY